MFGNGQWEEFACWKMMRRFSDGTLRTSLHKVSHFLGHTRPPVFILEERDGLLKAGVASAKLRVCCFKEGGSKGGGNKLSLPWTIRQSGFCGDCLRYLDIDVPLDRSVEHRR